MRAELERQYEALTARIAAIDRDLANELDGERRMALADKRKLADDERRVVVDQMGVSPSRATAVVSRAVRVENDELTRLIYEMRADLIVLKTQLVEHIARCQPESTGFPPYALTLLTVGGVMTLLLLVFLVIRIGMP